MTLNENEMSAVDYAVITQSLLATAQEMGAKLIRSAYSTILREARDGSAAIFDSEGNVVAQAELIPMQLGAMGRTLRACMDVTPPSMLKDGDFYINNDPFRGGHHLQDVFIYTPVIVEGEIIGYAGTTAHHLDLGGGNPGLSMNAPDVHAEGIIIPPSKYNWYSDWNGGSLQRIIESNIRVPTQTIGDFNAQFAANSVGAIRVGELCERYGTDLVQAVMEETIEYSEKRFRNAIADVPDGTYYGKDAVDDDGLGSGPLEVKATVTIASDRINIDFTGTCDQVRRNLNCPLSSTISAAVTAVKSVLTSPDIPFNEGMRRSVEVNAPRGCLLNPMYPAPNRARMSAAYRAFNAVMKALAPVVPEQVIAGGNDTLTSLALSHVASGGYSVYLEVFGGGYGASLSGDGCDAVDSPLSNCANTPVEALDMEFAHFRVSGYGLSPDSCGHGKHRGGLGFFRRYEILADNVNVATYSDRRRLAPYGLFGGGDGQRGACSLEKPDGAIYWLESKESLEVARGDRLTLYTSGGGAVGEPRERASELLEHDVNAGFISLSVAAETYGRLK